MMLTFFTVGTDRLAATRWLEFKTATFGQTTRCLKEDFDTAAALASQYAVERWESELRRRRNAL